MKIKNGFIILAFILITTAQVTKARAQSQTGPVTISAEIFTIPRDGKGVEKPFLLTKESKISLTLVSNKQRPALNVYLLDQDNYSKYKASGSLTNLNSVDSLSKTMTLGFQANGVLPKGNYVLLIQCAKSGLFVSAPAVTLKLISQEIVQKIEKPSITPTVSFWKKIF